MRYMKAVFFTRTKHVLITLICVISALISPPYPTQAATSPPDVLRAAVPNFAPLAYTQNGKPKGIIVDFLIEFSQRAGLDMNITVAPFRRALYQLETHNVDIGLLYKDPKVKEIAKPLMKLIVNKNLILVRRGIKIQQRADLFTQRLAVLRGGYFQQIFKVDSRFNYVESNNYKHSITLFKRNRVDGLTGMAAGLLYILKHNDIQLSEFDKPFVYNSAELWVFISPQSSFMNRIGHIKKTLETMQQENRYKHYLYKHVRPEWVPEELRD